MFLCRSNIIRDLSNILNRQKAANPTPGVVASTDAKPNPGSGTPTVKGSADKPADPADPVAMAKALATAAGVKYAELLKEYTEAKGSAYTQALASAIPRSPAIRKRKFAMLWPSGCPDFRRTR